jgi:hypothetical protein
MGTKHKFNQRPLKSNDRRNRRNRIINKCTAASALCECISSAAHTLLKKEEGSTTGLQSAGPSMELQRGDDDGGDALGDGFKNKFGG